MADSVITSKQCTGLKMSVRNNYFYGKLLTEEHFELETNYVNYKRWLLNRLVSGYGVVCGLNVEGCSGDSIIITRGLAIDPCGREITVPCNSEIRIPDEFLRSAYDNMAGGMQGKTHEQCETVIHVCICYKECKSDPVPALTGMCSEDDVCEPGTIREGYEIIFKEGKAPQLDMECRIPDIVCGESINYRTLAHWVSTCCPEPPEDPCIPLAEITLSEGEGHCPCIKESGIDITVRPIVYNNDLLFDLLKCLTKGSHIGRGGK